MVSAIRVKDVAQHLGFTGFIGSAIVLVGSTVFFNNAIVASISTLSGTLSLYTYVGIERDSERDQLKRDLEAKSAAFNSTQSALKEVAESREALLKKLQPYVADDGTWIDIAAQNRLIESLRSDVADLRQRFQNCASKLATAIAQRDSLKLEIDRLQGEIATFEGSKSHWVQKFDQMITTHDAEVESLTAQINQLNLENIQFKAQVGNVEEMAQLRAEKELHQLTEALSNLQKTYDQKMSDYVNLVTLYNELNVEYEAKLKDFNEKFAYLTGEGFKEVEEEFKTELTERDRLLLAASVKLEELEAPQVFDEIGEYVRANRLIKALWESEERVCLDASEIVPYADSTGFEVYFNLRDRRSRGQSFIEALNHRGNEFSVVCGTIKDLKFEYDRINPHRIKTALIFRKPAKIDSKTTIDKLWIPAEQFATKVPKLLKKPMSRVMGSTGEGKGVFVNLLLAVEANQPNPCLTRLHDPMDNSEEDYWNLPKTSKGAAQSTKAVKAFVEEFDRRLENGIAHPRTLDVFDEVDILADRDSNINKLLLNCSKGMRHNGMRACLIGQSPSVGKKGLEWADLDNFNCIYFGTAIITAIDKTPALSSKSEALRKEYQKLKDYCDRQNEELGLEGWNEYRPGLLVTQGRAYFFELPNADSIECDWSKLTQSVEEEPKAAIETKKADFDCPECNSSDTENRSGTKKLASGLNRNYRICKGCQHKFEVDL